MSFVFIAAGFTQAPVQVPRCVGTILNDLPRTQTQKLRYIQVLRSAAILIVLATHCVDPFPLGDAVRSPLMALLTRHINIVFIFVSGFLFQYLGSRFVYGSYLKTKLRNVIVPYVLASLPAIMIYALKLKPLDKFTGIVTADQPVQMAGLMLLTGTALAPFWFIPMMAIFYLISPLLIRLDASRRGYWILVPWLFVAMYVGRAAGDANPFQNAVFFGPVYVLGMCVSRYRETLIPLLERFWPILLITIILPAPIPLGAPLWDPMMLLTKILVCLGLVGLLARTADRFPPVVDYLGNISFGIYFVHYYIVAAITVLAARGHLPFLHGFPVYLALLMTVTAVSSLIVMVIKRIFGTHSRQIIGT